MDPQTGQNLLPAMTTHRVAPLVTDMCGRGGWRFADPVMGQDGRLGLPGPHATVRSPMRDLRCANAHLLYPHHLQFALRGRVECNYKQVNSACEAAKGVRHAHSGQCPNGARPHAHRFPNGRHVRKLLRLF